MSGFLASVNSLQEAQIALYGGADIIDLKDPARGALGAVSLEVQREVVQFVQGRRTVSATVGDLPMDAELMIRAIELTAISGVDLVKVGLPGLEHHCACLRALRETASAGVRLVAVLFAELTPPLWLLDELAQAGCHGVMLDTGDKAAGGLCAYMSPGELADFIAAARRLGLLNALGGSLGPDDIDTLLPLNPDCLGFRGALCHGGIRTAGLSPAALSRIRRAIPAEPRAKAVG